MKAKSILIGLFATLIIAAPASTSAESNYYAYDRNASLEQQIQELYSIIAQLQERLRSMYGPGYGYGRGNSDVDVETLDARNIDRDEASLYGRVNLRGARSARVWFDWGETRSFGEKTLTGTATRGQYTFRADLEDLDEDERYYYRAVARDNLGLMAYGSTRYFETDDDDRDDREDEPDVNTLSPRDIDYDSAELRGEVDMNDYRNGIVFFVYGEDEDQVEDVEDDYDSYYDVDEDGDDLQKVRVDRDLDDEEEYEEMVDDLDDNTDYYYQICVEYEDEDDDETLKCGGVEDFETVPEDRPTDDEPDVTTEEATNIDEDEAELNGEVDMNDFRNGLVFFVYGEDENQIEDVEDDYDSYYDVDEDGDDLQKERVDSDLDDRASYELTVRGLDDDTDYYYQICVEYEDEDDDETLKCGGVEDFTTDRD